MLGLNYIWKQGQGVLDLDSSKPVPFEARSMLPPHEEIVKKLKMQQVSDLIRRNLNENKS